MSSSMYHEYANEYATAVKGNIFNAQFERPSLLSLLPSLSGKKVLDLGCGPGAYAEELVARGATVTAIDISEAMVAITQSKLSSPHHCYQQDMAHGLPNEAAESYDVVICPLAIHYLENLDNLLGDVSRVMKRNGIFIFSTHHPYVDFSNSPSGNYFCTEQITEEWDTLGRPVTVSYYRRPISALAGSIANAGMVISNIAEGTVTEDLKEKSPELYKQLTTTPYFMFFTCQRR